MTRFELRKLSAMLLLLILILAACVSTAGTPTPAGDESTSEPPSTAVAEPPSATPAQPTATDAAPPSPTSPQPTATDAVATLEPTVIVTGTEETASTPTNGQDIVSILESDPQFSLLLQSLDATGLSDTLTEPGPYTLFAPTNAAFMKMLTASGQVQFGTLAGGTRYFVNDSFVDGGVTMTVREFELEDGTLYEDGFALVGQSGDAGGSGNDLHTNNVTVDFNFGGPISRLSMQYGAHGGNLNLEVNGERINLDRFESVTGTELGGAGIMVIPNPNDPAFGMLGLSGPIEQFAIGGQELWLDSISANDIDVGLDNLLFHLVPEALFESDLAARAQPDPEGETPKGTLTTVQGAPLTVALLPDGATKVNNGRLLITDKTASNGVIHAIDTVLIAVAPNPPVEPPDLQPGIEVWEPYPQGVPVPIGDAELVPGAPEMRQGVTALAPLLRGNEVSINTARTVFIEGLGERVWLAPIADRDALTVARLKQLAEQEALVVGVVVIADSATATPTPYTVTVRRPPVLAAPSPEGETLLYQLQTLDPEGKPIFHDGVAADLIEGLDERLGPTAAIFYSPYKCYLGPICFECSLIGILNGRRTTCP